MLKPDELFFRHLHRIEPRGGDFCILVPVVTAQKEYQRNCKLVRLREIERDHLGEQVRRCELVAIPVGPDKTGLWEEPNRKVPSGLSLALIGSYRPESGREGSTSNPSCLG